MSAMVLAQVSQRSATFQISYLAYSLAFSGLIGAFVCIPSTISRP